MDMSTYYLQQVREFVVENFLFGDGNRIEDDMSFMDNGIVDSTGMLEIVGYLENQFGIRVEDEELVPENMDSMKRIAAFITRKC